MGNNQHGNAEETIDPDRLDGAFESLRIRDRRYCLYFLLEHDTVSVRELVDVLTGWTQSDSEGIATEAERNRVRIDLRHRHLPALVETGLVHYDDEAETVSLDSHADTVRSVLELAHAIESRPVNDP